VSADILREAAALIEAAAAATPEAHLDSWRKPHVRNTLTPWVALMSPDVAAPLAAWLRFEAGLAESIDHRPDPIAAMLDIDQTALRSYADGNPPALALARVILSETP
jgi:hypothetical protein